MEAIWLEHTLEKGKPVPVCDNCGYAKVAAEFHFPVIEGTCDVYRNGDFKRSLYKWQKRLDTPA